MGQKIKVYKKIRKLKSRARLEIVTEMLSLPFWQRVGLAWRIVWRTK